MMARNTVVLIFISVAMVGIAEGFVPMANRGRMLGTSTQCVRPGVYMVAENKAGVETDGQMESSMESTKMEEEKPQDILGVLRTIVDNGITVLLSILILSSFVTILKDVFTKLTANS